MSFSNNNNISRRVDSTITSLSSSSSSSAHSRGSNKNNTRLLSTGDYDSLYRVPSSPTTESYYSSYPRREASLSSSSQYNSNSQYDSRSAYIDSLPPVPVASSSNRSRQRLEQCPEEEETQRYPIFPPTEEMLQKARSKMIEAESRPLKVIYAGDAIYKPDRGILSKTKRAHFVLTPRYLLVYKSAQKARGEIDFFENQAVSTKSNKQNMVDKDRIFLCLSDIYAVHSVVTAVHTFRIDYLHPQSQQPFSHTLTADTSKECQQWIQALRAAVSVYHPSMSTVTTSERYAAIDRVSKHADVFSNTDDMNMFKVVFKEKRYKTAADAPREYFLPIILAFGKFSFYLLPATVTDDEYRKTVERDRFGYLAIQSIRYDNVDDTVCIEVRQVNKKSRQLVFASTFCEDILRYFYRAINSIVPNNPLSLYRFSVPDHIKKAHIMPFRISPDIDDEMTGHDDEEMQSFNIILRAYTAALNLNKSRFRYTITGPLRSKQFVLLPPNEINGSPSTYQKHELLALFKTIQANTFFQEVCFANHSLDILENWKVESNDGWAVNIDHPLNDESVLCNELYSLLTSTKVLRKLDLTNCSIGRPLPEGMAKRSSAIATIGTIMQAGNTNLSRLSLGKNTISEVDFQSLIEGIKKHKKSIKELYLHECGLTKTMIEKVLWTLMEKNPEQVICLDLSTETKNMMIDSELVSKIVSHFRRLEILRMRGHDLIGLKYRFDLENSHLRELDISGSPMNTDTVSRLCRWMQTPAFNGIEALHLSGCGLNGRHVYELLCSVSQSGNRQMHLNLSNNPIMKEVMHLPKLHSAILQGEGPCSISFAGIEWDDSTLREFIDCLRDNQTISHIILSDIKLKDTDEISDDTVRMLTSLFERNTCIKEMELNFKENKATRSHYSQTYTKPLFTGALVQALYGLRHNYTLQYLDISGLGMEDAGAMALARVLRTNRTLQSIIVDDNNITIEGYRQLTKVIQDIATQVIDIPMPRNDLRFQLQYLTYRIEELLISINEAQFFLIHTVASDKKRAKTRELEILIQERKSCELALKNIEGVIQNLMITIQKNMRNYEEQHSRNMEFQLQAQAAAQELAIAQVRLQSGRANSVNSFNLSAVGGRQGSSSSASSTTSSVRGGAVGRKNSTGGAYPRLGAYHPLTRASTILNSDYYPRSVSSPISPSFPASTSIDSRMFSARNRDDDMFNKPHSYGSQPPVTPSTDQYYRQDYLDSSSGLISPPLGMSFGTRHVDDPGFISDFGYVDDFELGVEAAYSDVQKPNASVTDLDSIWDEDRVVDHFSRKLYLPPDARE
ncbi:RNI-like protein [Rhizopus microsporus var. microsporus]|uniref:RNI-like protein n=1 Tax=Rhizopus microsporus var. microsporus TaxID=86635 RepID=A0A1X0R373_RHIZD|nr:RNI-like protein [Rhizopus microsporus var. microsporus]